MRVLLSLGLLCVGLGPVAAQDGSPIVLSNVHIVDVTDGSIDEDQSVVIRDGRIAVVRDASVVTMPPGADLVDGAGKYLIPGLWDMLTHLLWSTDASEHASFGPHNPFFDRQEKLHGYPAPSVRTIDAVARQHGSSCCGHT